MVVTHHATLLVTVHPVVLESIGRLVLRSYWNIIHWLLYIQCGIYYGTCGLFLCTIFRNFQEAADKFSVAIKYNPGAAQYYGNRAKALSRMQCMEQAKQDAVCALVLHPVNDEASSSAPVHPCRMKNKHILVASGTIHVKTTKKKHYCFFC